ncbi:ROK family transcriptional regulator, partial [Streptomyces sp. NPDC079189]
MTEISAWDRKAAKGTPALAARVLELVASGQASSRAELAGLLGAAASTISLTVAHLVERGLIAEEGTQSSTGGRPRKVLRLGSNDEFAVAADLGGRHARIGVVLPGGGLTDVSTVPFVIADGPEAALPRLRSGAGAVHARLVAVRHGRRRPLPYGT